jgi:hypothetical protein
MIYCPVVQEGTASQLAHAPAVAVDIGFSNPSFAVSAYFWEF